MSFFIDDLSTGKGRLSSLHGVECDGHHRPGIDLRRHLA